MKQLNSPTKTSSIAKLWSGAAMLTGLFVASPAFPLTAQVAPDAVTTSTSGKANQWRTDLDETLAEAKLQNKLVLLRFTADWCAPCRVMDARVWPDASVQTALSDKYLIVKIDIDIKASQIMTQNYGVRSVPTLIVLKGNGDEIKRGRFMSSRELTSFLESTAQTNSESDPSGNDSS